MAKKISLVFCLFIVFSILPSRLFCDENDLSKILFCDLKNDGKKERVEIICEPLEDGVCARFRGLSIYGKGGKKLYEMESELDPEVGAFVRMFKVDQLRPDKKKQVLIQVQSNASIKMGDFRVIEWTNGSFAEIFKDDQFGLIEFKDIQGDGEKEIVEYRLDKTVDVFEYSAHGKKFVNADKKYKKFIDGISRGN